MAACIGAKSSFCCGAVTSATEKPWCLGAVSFGRSRQHRRLHSRGTPLCTARAQDLQQKQQQEIDDDKMGFLERLGQAWEILFPAPQAGKHSISNAEIAKQRLKMILISDRCSITDDAKKKIVDNIVGALADFVEIESEEKVQLNVLADPDLGTVYSVTVPVRRVKPEYQDFSKELESFECESLGPDSKIRTVGIRFDNPGLESQEA